MIKRGSVAATLRAEQGSCKQISQLRACARERDWLTRLLVSCSQLRVRARERELAHKTLGLLLSDQSACKRERDWLTRLLTYILESQVNLIR